MVCDKVLVRKDDFQSHVTKTHGDRPEAVVNPGEANPDLPKEQSNHEVPPRKVQNAKTTCPHCDMTLNKRNLKVHISRQHKDIHVIPDITSKRHHFTCAIDITNGIYTSERTIGGSSLPIHLVKITTPAGKLFCSNRNCLEATSVALNGGNPSFECGHLKSVPYAVSGEELASPMEALEELVDRGLLSKTTSESCQELQRQALMKKAPFCVQIPKPQGSVGTIEHFSVFTNTQRYWCNLERTIVSLQKKQGELIFMCQCCTQKRSCLHKSTLKWCLFNKDKSLFRSKVTDMECGQSDAEAAEPFEDKQKPSQTSHLQAQSEYLLAKKAIPVEVLQSNKPEVILTELIPDEENCFTCDIPLLAPQLVTGSAKILTTSKQHSGEWIHVKYCIQCK